MLGQNKRLLILQIIYTLLVLLFLLRVDEERWAVSKHLKVTT
jgi:hypothetical protein